jgi:hypothetical protein
MAVRNIRINNVLTERWNDDATAAADAPNANIPARSVRFYNADGTVASTRAYTAAENAAADAAAQTTLYAVNEAALLAKVPTALTANATYLALGAPTNAQTLAQVQRLTRQVNALLKLRANDLADTSGT